MTRCGPGANGFELLHPYSFCTWWLFGRVCGRLLHPAQTVLTAVLYFAMMLGDHGGLPSLLFAPDLGRAVQFVFVCLDSISSFKVRFGGLPITGTTTASRIIRKGIGCNRHGLIWSHIGWFLSDIHKERAQQCAGFGQISGVGLD